MLTLLKALAQGEWWMPAVSTDNPPHLALITAGRSNSSLHVIRHTMYLKQSKCAALSKAK